MLKGALLMSTITLKTSIFGTLDIDPDADLWEDCLIELDGKDLDVYLSIDGGLVTAGTQAHVLSLLEDLPQLYRRAKDTLHAAYPQDETVEGFVSFHLEEIDHDDLCAAFGVGEEGDLTSEMLFDALEPCAVQITRDDDGGIGCWLDFTIGKEYSDEVLCVRFNAARQIYDIAHES